MSTFNHKLETMMQLKKRAKELGELREGWKVEKWRMTHVACWERWKISGTILYATGSCGLYHPLFLYNTWVHSNPTNWKSFLEWSVERNILPTHVNNLNSAHAEFQTNHQKNCITTRHAILHHPLLLIIRFLFQIAWILPLFGDRINLRKCEFNRYFATLGHVLLILK